MPEVIRLLADGDSWLSMPRPWLFFGRPANIAGWLSKFGYDVKNISKPGDDLMSVYSDRLNFRDELWDGGYDACLLSVGGNDIAGKWDFHRLIFDSNSKDWRKCIDSKKLEKKVLAMKWAVEEFAEIAECGKVPIFMHTYDIPFPRKAGAKFLGGAITVEKHGWLDQYMPSWMPAGDKRQLIGCILSEFAQAVKSIDSPYLKVIDTQGTLADVILWRDEMHPTPDGMRLISHKIDKGIKDYFAK